MIISWNVTKACNLSCGHCCRDAGSKGADELDTAEGKALLNEIARAGFRIMVFSGGEPLLREDIFDLIEEADRLGLRPVLGTNGTLLTREIARRLKRAGCRRVGISLDSRQELIHDALRQAKGAWQKAVGAMELCREIGLEFQTHTTLTKDNYAEVEDIFDFAAARGAAAGHVFFLISCGRAKAKNNLALTPSEQEIILEKILRCQETTTLELKPVCAPQFIRIAVEQGIPVRFNQGCLAGISYCCILPNGDVQPCPYLPLTVDNVRKVKFNLIWRDNPVFGRLRCREYQGSCRVCRFRNSCGGCRAAAYAASGDYMAGDENCSCAEKRQSIIN